MRESASKQEQKELQPHVFLLTGCASGIGKHLTSVLLAKGRTVIATDVNMAELQRLAQTAPWSAHAARLYIRQLDVCSLIEWRTVMAETVAVHGGIDVVMNIAGYLKPGDVAVQPEAEVHRHLDINIKGVIFGSQVAAEHMTKQRRGHIINFGSLASINCTVGLGLYSASKHAVRAFSRVLAQEMVSHGVAVTVICPDAVQTPMLDLQVHYPEAALTFSGPRPLTVEDIERAIFDVVLPHRPRELGLPWSRYALAWAGELIPDSVFESLLQSMRDRGRRAQQAALKSRL